MSQSAFESVLDYYPVLRDLPEAVRCGFEQQGRLVSVQAGQVVFDTGAPCQVLSLLLAGSMRVSHLSHTGREILLYRVEPGAACILTISCLLGTGVYQGRGVAETDGALYAIPHALFLTAFEESSSFRLFVVRLFADRLLSLTLRLDAVAFHRVEARLASTLLSHGETVEATHQQLADELGSVREVVSRTLKQFEERGLVRLDRGQVQVLDSPGLARIAGSLCNGKW